MWVRGLKHKEIDSKTHTAASHPMWVRGLKQAVGILSPPFLGVAPHVGAWIETKKESLSWIAPMSHPMWVRGLKPSAPSILSRR